MVAASALGLSFAERTTDSLPGFLGLQVRSEINFSEDVQFAAWLRAAWKHEFLTERSVNAAFIAAPGYNFTVDGGTIMPDALRLTFGSKLAISDNVAIFGNLNTDLGTSLSPAYTGNFGLKIDW